ncbi:MAG: hypothetical protein Alpg2KO_19500 [Alphaproteobacteria bacterium]
MQNANPDSSPRWWNLVYGYKYTHYSFVAPMWVTYDGEVFESSNNPDGYYDLPDHAVEMAQNLGMAPNPLPTYSLEKEQIGVALIGPAILLFVIWRAVRSMKKQNTAAPAGMPPAQ